MYKEKLKTAAPMPKDEESISKNSMKLYSYLVCLSGLAKYPENTRMFRQKNIVLTKIQEATGITDKTAKLYLAYLEFNHKIEYKGEYHFNEELLRNYFEAQTDLDQKKYRVERRKAVEKDVFEIWKKRNKEEKEAVYYIRRPNPYTPVPEITLEKLNEQFKVSELEMKLYLLCCGYRDDCVYYNKPYKSISFENIRDAFGLKLHHEIDHDIRCALLFLKGIGLIEFQETYFENTKGAPVPCFKLTDVNYWISYRVEKIKSIDTISQQEITAICNRINIYLQTNEEK